MSSSSSSSTSSSAGSSPSGNTGPSTSSTSSGLKRPLDDHPRSSQSSSHQRDRDRDRDSHHGHSHGHGPPPQKKKNIVAPLAPPPPPPPPAPLPAESPSWASNVGPEQPKEDIKTLQAQHIKLRGKLQARLKLEEEMNTRIEQLELRQTQDDAVLMGINRYWKQLDEDIQVLLKRYDVSAQYWGSPSASGETSSETMSFLTQLSTWDKAELDSRLAERVEASTQAILKIIKAFDHLQERNERISKALDVSDDEASDEGESLEEILRAATEELTAENRQLEVVNTNLHEQYGIKTAKKSELEEALEKQESSTDELKEKVLDLEWEVSKLLANNEKLINHIQETGEKYRRSQQTFLAPPPPPPSTPASRDAELMRPPPSRAPDVGMNHADLKKENEELKEMANNKLVELEALHNTHKETLKEIEKLRMESKHLPESFIVETPAYKLLQSKFSVMYNESNQSRASFEDARQTAAQMRSQLLKKNEHMESEELLMQNKLRTEMIQLEDMLSQVRKEYESLRVDFEQNLTANEQTGPINREMRKLINSLQNHNQQLKGDANRSRKRYKEISMDMAKLKKERDVMEGRLKAIMEKDKVRRASREMEASGSGGDYDAPTSSSEIKQNPQQQQEQSTPQPVAMKEESTGEPTPSTSAAASTSSMASTSTSATVDEKIVVKKEDPDAALILPIPETDLKAQLKKALAEQRETKLLLDMYKSSGKDQRDKTVLIAAEKKARDEVENLRQVVKRYQDARREEKKKLADVDAVKKIKILEDQVAALQKSVSTQKSEEENLITEMEVTGQAFEEMQEQNTRLVAQLRDKDDANFKLLSERIKSSQLHKAAKEELATLELQVQAMTERVDAQNMVVRRLEEKERLVVNTIDAMEADSVTRVQACEGYKRKAVETAQSACELSLHLEKYQAQMKDAQEIVSSKTTALEEESYKTKRLQEEIVGLKRKVERLNKIEQAGNSDEIMLEEIKEYKETLTCPSCKVKRKDAVLTKCFHVFCFDCLRTRYETRQRKCPKCNAPFGANDYHKLYLT